MCRSDGNIEYKGKPFSLDRSENSSNLSTLELSTVTEELELSTAPTPQIRL